MSLEPTFSGFETIEAAHAHRESAGGWIFEAITGEVVWFHYRYTPTVILGHHAISGLTGKLV